MIDPHITITLLTGQPVTAPAYTWLQELILMLPPDDLAQLLQRVARARSPLVSVPAPGGPVPEDPLAYLNRDGTARRQLPKRS